MNQDNPYPRADLTALGVHIFAGGFTLGVQEHFNTIAQFEGKPHYGGATFRANFPYIEVHEGEWPYERYEHLIDFVFANPPCAPFTSNSAKSDTTRLFTDDPRCELTRETVALLPKIKPKVLLYESVIGAWTKGRALIDEFVHFCLNEGYAVTIYMHDAKWLGVPQERPRLFFIAHNVKLDFPVPDWTMTTVRDVLAGLNDVGEPYERTLARDDIKAILPHTPPDSIFRKTWDRLNPPETWVRNKQGNVKGRPVFGIRRAAWDVPFKTVAGYEIIHPDESRGLSINEIARIGGFPPMFDWSHTKDPIKEIARGVAPPVGEHIAKIVHDGIKRGEPVRPEFSLIDYRKAPV